MTPRSSLKLTRWAGFAAPVILLLVIAGCARREAPKPHLDHSDWLAVVLNDTIDVEEFSTRFETTPVVGKGIEAREAFLNALILERLLSQELDSLTEQPSHTHEVLLRQFREELIVEEYLRREVTEEIGPSEEELRKAFDRIVKSLWLDTWVFEDSTRAAQAYSRILSGTPFGQADTPSIDGDVLLVRDQPLGYGQTRLEIEDMAYSLNQGETGRPVFSEGKWWVMRPVRFKLDRIPSENAFRSMAPTLGDVVIRRKMEPEQEKFILDRMTNLRLQVNPEEFVQLCDYLDKAIPQEEESPSLAPTVYVAAEQRLMPGRSLEESAINPDSPLLTIQNLNPPLEWSVGETMERLAVLPKPLRAFGSDTQSALRRALIWRVQFEVLYRDALKTDVPTSIDVVRQEEIWESHLRSVEAWRWLFRRFATDAVQSGDTLTEEEQTRLVHEWANRFAESGIIQVRHKRLLELELSDAPVMLRKNHYPTRPVTPYPVSYAWAIGWDFP